MRESELEGGMEGVKDVEELMEFFGGFSPDEDDVVKEPTEELDGVTKLFGSIKDPVVHLGHHQVSQVGCAACSHSQTYQLSQGSSVKFKQVPLHDKIYKFQNKFCFRIIIIFQSFFDSLNSINLPDISIKADYIDCG